MKLSQLIAWSFPLKQLSTFLRGKPVRPFPNEGCFPMSNDHPRQIAKARLLTSLPVIMVLLSANAVGIHAANGDLLGISEALSSANRELVDLTEDSRDGTFWVMGANGSSAENHLIYHLSRDFSTMLGTVENPHPSGSIAESNMSLNRGIAFHDPTGKIFVLSLTGLRGQQSYSVRAVDENGNADPGFGFSIDLAPEDGASLYSLSYDIVSGQFWTLDINRDLALLIGLDGSITRSLVLPGKISGESTIRGQGLSFDSESLLLYVSYGSILDESASKIIQMTTEGVVIDDQLVGNRTGIEIPLGQIPGSDRRGITSYLAGPGQNRFAIIGGSGRIFQLEQVIPDIIPPNQLSCRLSVNGQVVLNWTNNGSGPGGSYQGAIQLLRNGIAFHTVEGNTTSHIDSTPVNGPSTYSLRAAEDGSFGEIGCECSAVVGPGGVINWTTSPSGGCYDLTLVPHNGKIYLTDDSTGTISILDADLNEVDQESFPSPWPNPGGIAFVPAIELGFPPQIYEDFLAISNTSDNRLRLASLANPESGTTISLRFPVEVENPRIGGLTYIPSDIPSRQRFVVTEKGSKEIYIFRTNGNLVRSCSPPSLFIDVAIGSGITYDPIRDTFLTGFEDGVVRELYTDGPPGTCPLTAPSFEIDMEGVGTAFDQAGHLGGIQISENTLLLCLSGNGTVFRILLFPFGPDFIRGDFDRDSDVNVTDAVSIARYLFLRGTSPVCMDAADSNDDGMLDISDPVYLLFYLFIGNSPPPPAPFPEAGIDPTFRDNLGCQE